MSTTQEKLKTIELGIKQIYTNSFAKGWALTNKWGVTIEENNTDVSDSPSLKVTWQRGWAGIEIGSKKDQETNTFGANDFTHIRLNVHTQGRLLNLRIEPLLAKDDQVQRWVSVVLNSNDFQPIEIPLQPYGDERFVAIRLQNGTKLDDVPSFYINNVELVNNLATPARPIWQGSLKESTQSFNHSDLWLSRLQNMLKSVNETIAYADNQTRIRLSILPKKNAEGESPNLPLSIETRLKIFEKEQIQIIELMLSTMHGFGQYILSHFTKELLPDTWNSESENEPPRVDDLRRAYYQYSIDLRLLQNALFQRGYDFTPENDEDLLKLVNQFWQIGRNLFVKRKGSPKLSAADVEAKRQHAILEAANILFNLGNRPTQAATLDFADILANKILQRAEPLLRSTHTVEAITYFSEATRVRILPYYTKIVLIGVPYSIGSSKLALSESSDKKTTPNGSTLSIWEEVPWLLLLIPHEIGHFFFWNGVVKSEESHNVEIDEWLRNTLVNDHKISRADWRYHWLEEVFADIFSCVMMGPISVIGLQLILSETPYEDWFLDNGYHPLPAIRPLLASHIIKRIYSTQKNENYNVSKTLDKLDENWMDLLRVRGFEGDLDAIHIGRGSNKDGHGEWHNHIYRDQVGGDEEPVIPVTMSLEKIKNDLEKVIDPIVDLLKGIIGSAEQKGSMSSIDQHPWKSVDINAGNDLSSLIIELNILFSQLPDVGDPRTITKLGSKFSDYVKNLPTDHKELAEYFKNVYLDNWGDKGPKGRGFKPGGG
ncbi:MAG: hypothetical protein AAGD96_13215 [Chloroflexota bacterium]